MSNFRNGFSDIFLIIVVAIIAVYFYIHYIHKNTKIAAYELGAQGVVNLKNKAITFYEKNGFLPNTRQLLSLPLDNQARESIMTSGYLSKHNIAIIYANPFPPETCVGITIQGTIEENIDNKTNVAKAHNSTSLLYNIVTVNVNGAWKTACSYNERGPKANPASINLDNCYNASNPSDMQKFQKQIEAFKAICQQLTFIDKLTSSTISQAF